MVHHAPHYGVGQVNRDTIAAVATPPGQGGIGIVRISGAAVPDIATAVIGRLPAPRTAILVEINDASGAQLDRGLALYFPAPHSYTGEDVLELHLHGSPVVLELVLAHVASLGARLARPGEYTERAFLNGKLDLAQAESVADLISASSALAARSALRSLAGEFSRKVDELVEQLTALRVHVEAALDFPDEEIDHLADDRIGLRLADLGTGLDTLLRGARQGALLQSGMSVVLAGPPNAGKSSLLNALARRDCAIVTPIAGTTRDVLRERIDLDGMPLHVIDTAGLRDTSEEIEGEGVRRARAEMARADRVLLMMEDGAPPAQLSTLLGQLPSGTACTVIRNKIDLTQAAPGTSNENEYPVIALSVKTGEGLDLLRAHLKACMGFQAAGEGAFIARARHVDALRRAQQHLNAANARLDARAGELVAEELAQAQRALGEITGVVTSDALLGRIFASFCIGK